MTEGFSAGFPHSEIHGSRDICSSPWLIAAYHVFLRLSVPRHPPRALFSLTSFPICIALQMLVMVLCFAQLSRTRFASRFRIPLSLHPHRVRSSNSDLFVQAHRSELSSLSSRTLNEIELVSLSFLIFDVFSYMWFSRYIRLISTSHLSSQLPVDSDDRWMFIHCM